MIDLHTHILPEIDDRASLPGREANDVDPRGWGWHYEQRPHPSLPLAVRGCRVRRACTAGVPWM